MKLRYLSTALAAALLSSTCAFAATTYVSPIQTYSCAAHTWANSLAAATAATACTQPAVADLANVAGGTVLGNPTGSSAAPSATAVPVLGVASTTAGTLGLASSGTAFTVTIQNTGVTPGSYNFNLPLTAGTSGQALTSGGGGSTAMSWSNVVTSAFVTSSKTTGYSVLAADDWKRFDNTGAGGSVTFTLPPSPTAGDNWCFLVTAAQAVVVLANTGETITMGNIASASAGNITSSTVGSSACLYFATTTAAYVWASNGTWVLT